MILLQGIFSSSFSTFLAIYAAKRIMRLTFGSLIQRGKFFLIFQDMLL